MERTFLQHRANHHLAMARYYDELYRLCEAAGYDVLSGDVEKLEPWESLGGGDMQPSYWPLCLSDDSDRGVIEIRHPELGWIGRVSVQSHGFYGTTVVNGNHDWNMSELRESLAKSVDAKRQRRDDDARLMA